MKIIFDLRNTGLGNGGGSITLIKSANILSELGNDVIVIDNMKNQCTWEKLKVEHLIIKNNYKIPKSDIVISTGFKSIPLTVKISNSLTKLKLLWIRGWENWIYSDEKIINYVLKTPLIKIVNSVGLYNKLNKYNVKSFIIRPGNDLNDFINFNNRNKNNIVIGGLYHTKHKTKRSDLIIKIIEKLKLKYKNIELHMFGLNSNPNNNVIDRYVQQPSIKNKNKFYNNVDIWLSTSVLEGLHIVPQEAMLCGCAVIGNDSELSGTIDYLINNETGLICSCNKNDYINKIELLIDNINLRNKLSKNGRKKIIELGNRKYNMNKFVELIYKLL